MERITGMVVRLARTAGFCMGVRRAVDMVLDLARHKGKEPIYTYGPLIHNPQTVELLRKRGIIPIDRTDQMAACEPGATMIIRAHGISPIERRKIREKGLRIVDATCPKVAHVQAIIKKHALNDYTILIVGDGDHPEVNGLLGYAEGRGIVIGSREDAEALPELRKVCVVAQTTQSLDEYEGIAAGIRERFADVVVFPTICESTEKRQAEVKDLAAAMDALFIVGGKNSANTRRLARLSERQGTPTFHIETADDLKTVSLPYEKVGVSAGASTPNWIIDRVVNTIALRQNEKRRRFRWFFNLWTLAVRTDIYSALGAGCLALAGMLLQNLGVRPMNLAITALYVFAMHTLNRFINRKASSIIGTFREESYLRHEKPYVTVALLSLLLALALAANLGIASFALLSTISLLGILYNAKILPGGSRFQSLRDLPGSKNVSMALAWAVVAAVLPWIETDLPLTPSLIVSFLLIFSLVFIRSAMSDMLDIQSDRLIGRETIPVLIGGERTQTLLKVIAVLLALLLAVAHPFGWATSLSFALLGSLFYVWICFKLYDRRSLFSGVVLEGLLETAYIMAGIGTVLWIVVTRLVT
jgi:(E)-4-hydroxy-3-methyl-but-2-enyl pyrophosphate reductase